MDKKTLLIIIAVILGCVALIFLIAPPEIKEKAGQVLEIGFNNSTQEQSKFLEVKEETDLYKSNIVYPRFHGIDEKFNESIKNEAVSSWEEFKKITQENWQALKDTAFADSKVGDNPTDPFEFDLNCDVVQESDEYISLIMRYGGYPGGGAHGYQNLKTFTYDVKNKKELKISDIFPNNPNYLEKLSQYSRKELIKNFSEDIQDEQSLGYIQEMINMGTEAVEDNFKNFTISKDRILTIYFPQYQVAPYAAGEQKIEIDLNSFN